MRTAKIPHPLVRNPPIQKIPGFVPADKPVAICMGPTHRLTFAIHTGLRLFLKFVCVGIAPTQEVVQQPTTTEVLKALFINETS